MSEEGGSANLCCRTKCEYINCRAVTGRKIDIHGAVSISVRVFRRKGTDIISDIDDPNIEQRRGTAPATIPMGYSEKYLMVRGGYRNRSGPADNRQNTPLRRKALRARKQDYKR